MSLTIGIGSGLNFTWPSYNISSFVDSGALPLPKIKGLLTVPE